GNVTAVFFGGVNWGSTYALSAIMIQSGFAEIRINEFMASNTRAYPDITDFEDYPDWIELHNSGDQDQSLRGFHLSDDPEVPLKWSFPKEAMIPAGGFLVVLADGHDTNAGVEFRRTSFGRPLFTTEKYHTNFSLSADGETILLTEVVRGITVQVGMGDSWKYRDDGSDLGLAWRQVGYDDQAWDSSIAPLGYGDPVSTVLSYGSDEEDRHVTSYFRKSFQVADPDDFEESTLELIVDDGALVYLNGNLIVSQNMTDGFVNYLTPALSPVPQEQEMVVTTYELPQGLLLEGENVLAVEVHQINNLSQDLRFDLSLSSAKILGPELRETVSYSQQVTDVSSGRDENDPEVWVNFAEPTPGAANGGPLVDDLRLESDDVGISPAGGLVEGPVMVQLSAPEGDIFYTLDGSNPSTEATLYEGPFEIEETTVVRARCFVAGKIPGPIATKSYFLGESFSGLPFLSVVADPETLFGDEIGIYLNTHERGVGIGPSVYKGKDAPGHLEFFPEDGSEGFGVNGGFRIGGENNWSTHFQRALNFYTRGKYGDDGINYDLFPDSGIPTFTSLTLREGGDDWGKAHLTDALFDSIVRDRMEVESNRFRPAVLFINGEYWGLYNIRDRWDDNWLFQHYGTSNGEYDRINLGNGAVADHGTTDDFDELIRFLDAEDVNDPDVWAEVERRIDIVSAVDFVIAEGYGRNSSWGGNREIWRDHRPGGKWRYFIPDMDRTFGNSSFARSMASLMAGDQVIRRIRGNEQFKRLLAQRYAAHLVTTFDEGRMHGLIDHFSGLMSPELPRQRDRWNGFPSESNYTGAIQRMKDFVTARSGDVIEEIQSVLALDPAVTLTLAADGAGSFEIEGVPIEPGALSVFPNIGLKLKAVPAPGFRFDGWVGEEGGSELETVLAGSATLTAKFVLSGGSPVSGTLSSDTSYPMAGSPYFVVSDLMVPAGVTLTIEEGVSLMMSKGSQIRVEGTLNIEGSSEAPVEIVGVNGDRWGGDFIRANHHHLDPLSSRRPECRARP
ncbi:CotH kinase family protein, partial [Akkermansiaceae bacterium]|nr:CotH kinase family protein [Akkermansiaceae bacterium]